MSMRKILSTVSSATALVMISSGAMAQTSIPIPEPGTIGITAMGIGLAFYLVHRNRK